MKKRMFLFFLIFIICRVDLLAQEEVDTEALLSLSLEDLMNIKVVTPSKFAQNIKEAPAIIKTITATAIRNRGYRSVAEILETFSGIYGIDDYHQKNFGIRGINDGNRAYSRSLKIMIDGIPVSFRSSSENFTGPELIPVQAIDRIEFIKGPSSSLYGANSFLGVVNIITKKDIIGEKYQLDYTFSTGDNLTGNRVDIFGKKNIKDVEFILAASLGNFDRSGLKPENIPGKNIYNGTEKSENDIARPFGLLGKINNLETSIGSFDFLFHYLISDSYGEFQDWSSLTHRNRISIDNFTFALSNRNELNKNLENLLRIVYSSGSPMDDDRFEIDKNPNDWIYRDVGFNSCDIIEELNYNTGNANIVMGGDLRIDEQNLQTFYSDNIEGNNVPNQGIVNGDSTFIEGGIFVSGSYNLSESLILSAGIRYDYQNLFDDIFNYRFAINYLFNDDYYFKLISASSYKAPAPNQLFSNYIVQGGLIGNPELKPEKARSVELLAGGELFENLGLKLNGYYTVTDDKIEPVLQNGDFSNTIPANVAKIYSGGFEAELTYMKERFSGYLNFSYQKTVAKKPNLIGKEVKLKTPLYPDIMLKFGLLYKFSDKTSINFDGEYIGKRIASYQNSFVYNPVNFRTDYYKLDEYYLLNLFVRHDFKLTDKIYGGVSFRIKNLTDKKFYYPGFYNYDIPDLGRYLEISLKVGY